MKKIIFLILFLMALINAFSQKNNPAPYLTNQDYLAKSKKQKTGAWVLLGGGAVIAAGSVMWAVNSLFSDETGTAVLFYTGCASMLGSIPLFIASSKNKKRAMGLSFKYEPVLHIQKSSFTYKPIPSLKLKISL